MKRILALMAIFTLLTATAAGCSKKKDSDADITPTGSVSDNAAGDSSDNSGTSIVYGGSYTRDNIKLTFGIADGSWTVSGFLPKKEDYVILSGAITPKELPAFTYTDGDNLLTFTFGENSVKVDVNMGTKYSDFAGTYKRTEDSAQADTSVVPEKNSSLEQLGRIALAFYTAVAKGTPELGVNISASSYNSEYMQNIILAYTDLFLTDDADFLPEIFDQNLCFAFPAEELDALLRNASFGKFTLADFTPDNSTIRQKDGTYYVLCRGTYAGGLTVADKTVTAAAGTLTVTGKVFDTAGSVYTVEMTLTTVESTDENTADIIIESIMFKTK